MFRYIQMLWERQRDYSIYCLNILKNKNKKSDFNVSLLTTHWNVCFGYYDIWNYYDDNMIIGD